MVISTLSFMQLICFSGGELFDMNEKSVIVPKESNVSSQELAVSGPQKGKRNSFSDSISSATAYEEEELDSGEVVFKRPRLDLPSVSQQRVKEVLDFGSDLSDCDDPMSFDETHSTNSSDSCNIESRFPISPSSRLKSADEISTAIAKLLSLNPINRHLVDYVLYPEYILSRHKPSAYFAEFSKTCSLCGLIVCYHAFICTKCGFVTCAQCYKYGHSESEEIQDPKCEAESVDHRTLFSLIFARVFNDPDFKLCRVEHGPELIDFLKIRFQKTKPDVRSIHLLRQEYIDQLNSRDVALGSKHSIANIPRAEFSFTKFRMFWDTGRPIVIQDNPKVKEKVTNDVLLSFFADKAAKKEAERILSDPAFRSSSPSSKDIMIVRILLFDYRL